MHSAERTRFVINRQWAQLMLHSNMQSFDYSNILPARGPIVAGISLTHRPRENFGPQLEFGDECKSIRPKCPTCSEIDALAFAGMDAITKVDKERRETMVHHLRKRVQHCGFQAARADHFAYSWHREGNNASMVMHHFHMANMEADKRKLLQPPVHRPPPRIQSPPPADINQTTSGAQPSSTPSVTVTMVTQVAQGQVAQHAPTQEAPRSRSYTDAVKGGKRPATSHPSSDIEISGLTQPKQDMRSRNINLLNPNYEPDGDQQQPLDSLQTPRPNYSPITPTEVERYLHERSPGTPYFQGINNAEDQQDSFHPAHHLARLTTRTFETSNNETALECAKHVMR